MAELRNGYNLNPDALWVGEVPNGWEFIKGKYLFGERFEKGNDNNLELLSPTQKYGVIPQNMYDELSGMRAVKVKESTDLSSFKTVHIGDFCISLRSFQGGFEYSKYEGVVSPAYHILYPKKKIVDGYFKYLFKEQSFIAEMNSYCQSLRDGKNISYDDFGNTLIPYPPLSEQQAIAAYLDERCSKIDELIAEAAAGIAEYKELKQAVIFEAVTKGLDKNVPLKDSGDNWIGKCPSHYKVAQLSMLSTIVRGGSPRPAGDPRYYGGNIPFMRISDITRDEGMYVEYAVHSITEEGLSRTREVPPYTLLLTNSGATLGVPKITTFKTTFNDGIAAFLNIDDCLNIYFAYYFLKAETAYFLENASMGMGQPNLNTDIIGRTHIVLPPKAEQVAIVEYLEKKCNTIDSLISEKQALIDDLQAYKKSLIYEVVTGKRRVG